MYSIFTVHIFLISFNDFPRIVATWCPVIQRFIRHYLQSSASFDPFHSLSFGSKDLLNVPLKNKIK